MYSNWPCNARIFSYAGLKKEKKINQEYVGMVPCSLVATRQVPCSLCSAHTVILVTYIPYHAIPYHAMLYHTIPCHAIPYLSSLSSLKPYLDNTYTSLSQQTIVVWSAVMLHVHEGIVKGGAGVSMVTRC